MTKKQIKEYYNNNFNNGNERVVDVDVFEGYGTFVNIITVTHNHIVWKERFEIVDGSLKFLDSKVLA